MELTEVLSNGADPTVDEAALRAWDWKAALAADERSIPWLARKTHRSDRAVYGYSRGEFVPPLEWLAKAAAVLGGPVDESPDGA